MEQGSRQRQEGPALTKSQPRTRAGLPSGPFSVRLIIHSVRKSLNKKASEGRKSWVFFLPPRLQSKGERKGEAEGLQVVPLVGFVLHVL